MYVEGNLFASQLVLQLCNTVKNGSETDGIKTAVTQLFLPADELCLVTEAAGHEG